MATTSAQRLEAGRVPGERIQTTTATSNSGNITTTETTVMTITAGLVSGRTYAVWARPKADTSVAGDKVDVRLRENNSSGTEMQLARIDCNDASGRWPGDVYAEYTAVATGNKTFVCTFVRASGTGNIILIASATIPSYMGVDYISG